MMVKTEMIAGVLTMALDTFITAHKLTDTEELRAAYFAGAALSLAIGNTPTRAIDEVTALGEACLIAMENAK